MPSTTCVGKGSPAWVYSLLTAHNVHELPASCQKTPVVGNEHVKPRRHCACICAKVVQPRERATRRSWADQSRFSGASEQGTRSS